MINCHRHVVSSHTKCPFSLQHKVRGRSLGFVGWLSYDEDAGNVEEAAPFANDDGVCLGMFQTYIYSVMEYIRLLFVTQTCGAGMTNLSVFVSSEVVCGSCKLRISNWSGDTLSQGILSLTLNLILKTLGLLAVVSSCVLCDINKNEMITGDIFSVNLAQ